MESFDPVAEKWTVRNGQGSDKTERFRYGDLVRFGLSFSEPNHPVNKKIGSILPLGIVMRILPTCTVSSLLPSTMSLIYLVQKN